MGVVALGFGLLRRLKYVTNLHLISVRENFNDHRRGRVEEGAVAFLLVSVPVGSWLLSSACASVLKTAARFGVTREFFPNSQIARDWFFPPFLQSGVCWAS